MTRQIDPQIGAALQKLFGAAVNVPPPAAGDWKSRRANAEAFFEMIGNLRPTAPDVTTKRYETKSADRAAVELRWFTKAGANPGAGVFYIHGSGMIGGA